MREEPARQPSSGKTHTRARHTDTLLSLASTSGLSCQVVCLLSCLDTSRNFDTTDQAE